MFEKLLDEGDMLIWFCFLAMKCPVLIGWGERDPWEPIKLGRAYGAYSCVEEFVVLPNVGHCPQVSLIIFK